MTNAQQVVSPNPLPYRTQVAYLVDDDEAGRPIGVRVVEPPVDTRQAMRGNLYAIVDLSGDNPERAAFAERLLSVIQRTYYTLKGSQSLVLTEALREARRVLEEFNAQSASPPLEGNILIAALLGERLLMVGAGAVLAIVSAGRGVDVYPPVAPSVAAAPAPAPAAEPLPEIYRQNLQAGNAFFLGVRTWLQFLPLRQLAGTIAYLDESNFTDAAAGLRDLNEGADLPGLIVLLTPGPGLTTATAAATATTGPTAFPSLLRRTRGASGLPTAVNALPPVATLPNTEQTGSAPDSATAVAAYNRAPPTTPSLLAAPSDHETSAAEPAPASVTLFGADRSAWQQRFSKEVSKGAKVGFQRARELLTNLLPERFAPAPADALASSSGMSAQPTVGHAPSSAAKVQPTPFSPAAPLTQAPPLAAVGAAEAVAPVSFAPISFTPPARAQGSRARLFVLLAVLILALVPVVVAAVYWQQGASNRAEAATLLDLAEARFNSARQALDTGDKVTARSQLTEALGHIEHATQINGPSSRGSTLSAQIHAQLERVLQVQPLYGLAAPLVKFPPDAQPHRVLVIDQDIYVLDVGRQLVQHFIYDPKNNTVPDPDGEIILRQGDPADGATVGRLVDMAWQPPVPGIDDKANLLVLDRSNHIFRFNRLEGIKQLKFAGQSDWKTPVQLKTYSGRLYLADEGAGQVFRYTAGAYDTAPETWFAPQTQVNLAGLLTLNIDGDIWLLFSNGMILRYHGGEQVPFSLENSVGLAQEPVDMIVGDQGDSSIYLADSAQERILIFDKDGKYQRQLKAAEGNPLHNLSGLFVNEVTGSIFLLTQSALYQHTLPASPNTP